MNGASINGVNQSTGGSCASLIWELKVVQNLNNKIQFPTVSESELFSCTTATIVVETPQCSVASKHLTQVQPLNQTHQEISVSFLGSDRILFVDDVQDTLVSSNEK